MKYIIANWKAHESLKESQDWLDIFVEAVSKDISVIEKLKSKELTVVICPSSAHLYLVKERLVSLPDIMLGTQSISTIEGGGYTGETTVKQIKDWVTYSIVGHSERRAHFNESESDIEKQITLLKQNSITSILCFRKPEDTIYPTADIVCYEPPNAIASGNNASLQNVLEIKKSISLAPHQSFLYGGSVDEHNCQEYFSTRELQGILVGTASHNPLQFYSIIKNS